MHRSTACVCVHDREMSTSRMRFHANVPVPAGSSDYEADETSDRTPGDHHCGIHKFSVEVADNSDSINNMKNMKRQKITATQSRSRKKEIFILSCLSHQKSPNIRHKIRLLVTIVQIEYFILAMWLFNHHKSMLDANTIRK